MKVYEVNHVITTTWDGKFPIDFDYRTKNYRIDKESTKKVLSNKNHLTKTFKSPKRKTKLPGTAKD